jgi:dTDP-4-amino-4,6-dideoxygalactose transaminase
MQQLAVCGGPRAVPEGMVKTWPPITRADRDAVMAVFDSNIFHGNSAPNAVALQKEWAETIGVRYCLATNSGTSALHMALASVGVGPGDEVIVPAFTYWSSAAAVLHHNAIPVFVDIEPDNHTIDPARIHEKLTECTKAIMPVHVHGMPADLDSITEIADRNGLLVVEDACQAHGAKYKGRSVGGIGQTAGFSTNRLKNLSSGEGGLFTTNSEDYYRIACRLREFGEVVVADQGREYNAYGLGWNYRPHEFVSAFCRAQLKRFPQYNAQRREYAELLTERLRGIPGVSGPTTPEDREPVYFSYVVEFRPKEVGLDISPEQFKAAAQIALEAEGIELGQWQRTPVPAQSVFQDKVGYGKGCPWTCQHYGRDLEYRGEDYPETVKFIAAHAYLKGVYPPNTIELMERYAEGFEKVMSRSEYISRLTLEPLH